MKKQVKTRGKVLVVEDDQNWQEYARRQIGGKGYDVLTAFSATEALQILRRSKEQGKSLDIVVTDINLIGMHGTELIQILREEEKFDGQIAIVAGLPVPKEFIERYDLLGGYIKGSDGYLPLIDRYESLK
ncbi:response regulator [Candidatus Pacearchaeota archaeon]|nr:response regulator [Candidatus Pacearchaeota archaeon]